MTQTTIKFTRPELRRILTDLDAADEPIVPLTDAEVAEIEAAYVPGQISPEHDARQRAEIEALRQEFVGGAPVHYGQLLADIERAFQQLEPEKHESFWYNVLTYAHRGGLSLRIIAMSECMAGEVE